jgi:hypothetical protein
MAPKQTRESKAYTAFCDEFDLKPEWLGKSFKCDGETLTITGLNIRSKKFPVTTNSGSSFSADFVRGLMTGDPDLFLKMKQKEKQEKLEQARADYTTGCFAYGLKKEWLDWTFVYEKKTFRIDGLFPNARRFNVVCWGEDNKVHVFQSDVVAKLMKESKAVAA